MFTMLNFSTKLNSSWLKERAKDIWEGGYSLPVILVVTLFMALVMFMPSLGHNLRIQESIFPIVAIGVLVACFIFVDISKSVGVFMLYFVIVCMMNYTFESYAFLVYTIIYGTLYLIIIEKYKQIEKYRGLICGIICTFALLNVLWIFLQSIGIYWLIYPLQKGHYTGLFANRIETGAFLAACTPFFFYKNWWRWGALVVCGGFAIMGGMMGVICTVSALIIYALVHEKDGWKKKAALVLAAMGVIAAYGVTFGFGAWQIRAMAYSKAIILIQEKPVFGWGLGQGQYLFPLFLNADKWERESVRVIYNQVVDKETYKKLYLKHHEWNHKFTDERWPEIHNDYLQLALDAGIVSILLFLWVIGSHFKAFWKTRDRNLIFALSIGVILLAANSFFVLQLGRFVFMTVFFAAIIQGDYLKTENN